MRTSRSVDHFCFPLTGGTQACIDRDYRCYTWARYGYCRTNMYTRRNCQKSCRLCPRPPTVKPKPPTVRPKPPTVKPKPPTVGPKPPTVRPKPSTSKPVVPSKGKFYFVTVTPRSLIKFRYHPLSKNNTFYNLLTIASSCYFYC